MVHHTLYKIKFIDDRPSINKKFKRINFIIINQASRTLGLIDPALVV